MFIYKNKRNWYRYFIPCFMNPITYELYTDMGCKSSKIYRWLIFGWVK